MFSRAELTAHLRDLGVRAGDVLMVHASVRAVGPVAGGPDQIHRAIRDAVTDTGTVLMYASCQEHYDDVGRGVLTAAEEAELIEKLPPFDAATARSARDNGALVELLRTWPGTRVNDHVARFASSGPHTDLLFAVQPWDFAFGAGSALERFVELDGRILLLGSDHDAVTFLHYVEHVADFPDKRIARFKVPVLDRGRRVWRDMAEVDTSNGAHASWPDRFFARIVDGHVAATGNTGGIVGHARAFLISARALLAHAQPIMERVARGAP